MMKYLFALLLSFVALPVLADPPATPKTPNILVLPFALPQADPSPTPEDFEHYLARYKEDVFNPDFWKDKEIVSRATGEKKKVSNFSKTEQETFIFMHADRLTQEMTMLTNAWGEELKKFDDPNHKLVPREKVENDKQKPATKEQVDQYNKDLATVRKGFAVKFEAYAEKFLKNSDLPEKEQTSVLKAIREFHDANKLIERKKDK